MKAGGDRQGESKMILDRKLSAQLMEKVQKQSTEPYYLLP